MKLFFSIIVPVYNRPDEIKELLESLTLQSFRDFEVVIVDDGSTDACDNITDKFKNGLDIKYFYKPNSGPGDSRNFGMNRAGGNYFIILDSDCILPRTYMEAVNDSLNKKYVDFFGGADAAHESFSDIQKAIDFSMTSVLTTGGIRGSSEKLGKFQPRSFNMGISKIAFETTGGFGKIHPGEDPELTFRLWKAGFQSKLIKGAEVFHKRRISWDKFRVQVNKFGKVRPILNKRYPEYVKHTFWLPSLFIMGIGLALILLLFGKPILLYVYLSYFLLAFVFSTIQYRSVKIGLLSLKAILIQFWGYGTGFLQSFWRVKVQDMEPESAYPELFFED